MKCDYRCVKLQPVNIDCLFLSVSMVTDTSLVFYVLKGLVFHSLKILFAQKNFLNIFSTDLFTFTLLIY